MTKTRERFLENIELVKLMRDENFDEVDSLKVMEKDGVECLSENESLEDEIKGMDSFHKEQAILDYWGLL